MSRAALVVNPIKISDSGDFSRQVDEVMAAHGWEPPLWLETTPEDPGVGMARAAVEKDVDVVFAAGGDGTIRACATGLAGTGVPLAVLPLGTGNLLARNLDLPADVEAAVVAGLTGMDRPLDLGRVGDERFVVMAGVGFDAAMMRDAPEGLKDRLGWPAYVVSALRHLRDRAVGVELVVDEQPPLRLKATGVVIGNVGNLQGGIPLLPDASPYDGRLDVVVLTAHTVLGWLRVSWRVLTRQQHDDSRIVRRTGRRISVRTRNPQPRQFDGDLIEESAELVVEVEPAALIVRFPREAHT